MGHTIRYYLFPEDQAPVRLPRELVERLSLGEDFLPTYANTRQKVLEIILENVEGKPDTIAASRGAIWGFDEQGGVADSLREMLAGTMDHLGPGNGNGKVVDLKPKIRKKQFENKHRWTAGQAELDLVAKDIFSNGRASGIKTVKGATPKAPALTLDAKRALRELNEPFYKIQSLIEDLKETGLAGLAHEARKLAGEFETPSLYRALAEMADQRGEILRRHRKGDGTWFALVEITEWKPSEYAGRVGTLIDLYHVECVGKKAAVVAARSLLAEHASRFSDAVTVEAFIETDLEWDAAGRA